MMTFSKRTARSASTLRIGLLVVSLSTVAFLLYVESVMVVRSALTLHGMGLFPRSAEGTQSFMERSLSSPPGPAEEFIDTMRGIGGILPLTTGLTVALAACLLVAVTLATRSAHTESHSLGPRVLSISLAVAMLAHAILHRLLLHFYLYF